MSVYKHPTGRWQVSYRDEHGKGRTKMFPPGRDGKKDAEAFDIEVKLKKKTNQPLPLTSREGCYFDDLAQLWLDQKKAEGRAHRWLKEWAETLNRHFIPELCRQPAHMIDQADVMAIIGAKYAAAAQATRNRYIGYLKAIFEYGVENGHIPANPLRRWKKQREAPRQPLLTVEDLERIMRQAAPHLAWAIEVEWNIGCRAGASELLALKWEHIDHDKGGVWVYGQKTKSWRFVPLDPGFLRRLWALRQEADCEHVVSYAGRPMKKFRSSLATACRRAGIPYDVRMYDIRHLFASTLLAKGADLAAVSRILGHADIATTQRSYYHLQAGEKERAVSLLPKIGGVEEGAEKVVDIASRRGAG
jgi:integrase